MPKDAAYGQKALKRIQDDLERPDALESKYAQLLLEKAQQNATSRPTPQSAMAADALVLSGNVISSPAGTPAGEVSASSEFGSDIYPQFQHTHDEQGLWLHPAAEDVQVLQNMDQELEQMLQDNV